MNIAHLLPYSAQFPLQKHHGRYEWVLRLAQMQVAGGDKVTIYAGDGSSDEGGVIIWKSLPRALQSKLLNNTKLLKEAFQESSHDIYHSHFDYLHYQLGDWTHKPIVFTQHWFPNKDIAQAVLHNPSGNVLAVPPTHYMLQEDKRMGIPAANTIYHGIDLDFFRPLHVPVIDRLIFVGRITAEKGVLEAVQIALINKQRLDIVGKLNNVDREYWEQIAPLVDDVQIRYHGPKSQRETALMLAQSKGLLFPSQSLEAFGQVIIEAQACGTPVIISNLGASHELVEQGKSGFVIENTGDYGKAIQKLSSISRSYCRKFAEQFDIHGMTKQYTALYTKLLSGIKE